METNYSLLFYLKKPKNYTTGPIPIYIRITVNAPGKEVSTGRKCEPHRWCSKSNRESGNKESTRLLNSYLDELYKRVEEAHTLLTKERKEITSISLKNKFLGKAEKKHMLMELFTLHNKQMEELIGNEYEDNTLKGYKTTFRHLTSYLMAKYKVSDICINALDYNFIKDFEHHLKTFFSLAPVSAKKYIKNFKKVVNNYCIKPKLLKENPFSEYTNKAKAKEREFLHQVQLDRIVNKEIRVERIDRVRDIFVFCCYTGLSYADVKKLKRSEIMTGVDGGNWVFTSRKKTETNSSIPLLKPAINIINKYKKHPLCSEHVLPVLSNQKMNSYLKEIADMCDITQNLTFHLSRHTFATTVTLSNGVPIESVSKMLGHLDLKTTQHYAKVVNTKVSNDMKALKKRLAIA
ncbi:MAG: site-specific integrase [Bacteroidota bacterium]